MHQSPAYRSYINPIKQPVQCPSVFRFRWIRNIGPPGSGSRSVNLNFGSESFLFYQRLKETSKKKFNLWIFYFLFLIKSKKSNNSLLYDTFMSIATKMSTVQVGSGSDSIINRPRSVSGYVIQIYGAVDLGFPQKDKTHRRQPKCRLKSKLFTCKENLRLVYICPRPRTSSPRTHSILIPIGKGGMGGGGERELNPREGERGNSSQTWVENTNMTDCIFSLQTLINTCRKFPLQVNFFR